MQEEPLQKASEQPSLFGGSVVGFGQNKASGSLFQSEPKSSTPDLQGANKKDNEDTKSGELTPGATKTEAATTTAAAAVADGGNSSAPKPLGLFSTEVGSSTSAGTSIFGSTFGSQPPSEKSAEPKVPSATSVPKFSSATADAPIVVNGISTPSSEPAVSLKQPSEAAAVPQSGLFGFQNPGT